MKQEDLQALKLNEEQLSGVLALAQADAQTIQTLETVKSQLEQQLGDANKTLQGYDPEWKAKAEQAQQDANNKIAALQREFAIKEQTAALHFSSESAKKAFLTDLTTKELPLQEGKMLGFDDFVEQYKKNDPAAFAQSQQQVRFAASATGTSAQGTLKDQANAAIRAAFGTQS